MKINRLLAICVVLVLPLMLWAQEISTDSLVLLAEEISHSTPQELTNRLSYLGLSKEGSEEVLRERLYTYYNITPSLLTQVESESSVTIDHAQKAYLYGTDEPIIVLEGDVQLSLHTDKEATLFAQYVAFDVASQTLSAYKSIRLIYDEGESEDQFEGSVVSLSLKDGSLFISDSKTHFNRTIEEQEEITFFSEASSFQLVRTPYFALYNKGRITTDVQEAYFNIKASTLSMVEGGDLFATNASISLGRVPLLWLPFFYYPGRTLIFNPSFGIDSTKGLFFSATVELYGTYPNIKSDSSLSFSSLMANEESQRGAKEGWIYTADEFQSPLQKWAEQSNSYLALLIDVYEQRGLFMGVESENNLFSKKLKLKGFGALAFSGNHVETLSFSYQIPPFRYGVETSVQFNEKYLKFNAEGSLYSDPLFAKDFKNRLTYFSLSSFESDYSIPTTIQNDVTSTEWLFSLSASLPSTFLSPIIETFSIERLSGKVELSALSQSEGPGYRISSFTLPNLSFKGGGTLLSLKKEGVKAPSKKEEAEENPFFKEWSLLEAYSVEQKERKAASTITTSSLQVAYSLKGNYIESATIAADSSDQSRSIYTRLLSDVTIKGALAPSIVSFTQKFEPLYLLNVDNEKHKEQTTLKSYTDLTIPKLGFTYSLHTTVYNQISQSESQGWLSFDKDSVSRHQAALFYPISIGSSLLEASLSATLSPLPLSFSPSLYYAIGRFSARLTHSITEKEEGEFVHDTMKLTLRYLQTKLLDLSFATSYRWKLLDKSYSDPLLLESRGTLTLFNSILKVSEQIVVDFNEHRIDRFLLSTTTPYASLSIHGGGSFEHVSFDLLDTSLSIPKVEKRWWLGRISLSFSLELSYKHSFIDQSASLFGLKTALNFSIAQFLSLDIALHSVNKGFHQYNSFKEVWDDLLRSFDFFGEGRMQTQFTMESIEISLIHYMRDWDLHCKYSSSVVLSDSQWKWSPTFSLYVMWKVIPEIKIDRQFDLTNTI